MMGAFRFPQPGERQNAATVPVPERTLAALYALALVGEEHLTTQDMSFVTPQCHDALEHTLMTLSDEMAHGAHVNAQQMVHDLKEEFPF
jgi:hypothetical protein